MRVCANLEKQLVQKESKCHILVLVLISLKVLIHNTHFSQISNHINQKYLILLYLLFYHFSDEKEETKEAGRVRQIIRF